ncbi:unnamed protein product [Rotaria socialis]|uniref:C2 domain-containing protein n=1 Tax=Rotaria socialis TaxID=392032 RepID=A0A821C8B8_9BILA|nr:unnamed protein product [Rotaria socialis]
MLNSLKKWVQDVAVDLTPPVPPQPSTSSPALSSSLNPRPTNHYHYSSTPSYDLPHFSEHLPKNSSSTMGLSRPISMDSVRSTRLVKTSIPPPPASPAELDLSHLNREEQEHIANVLRRARAVDEQQSSGPLIATPSARSPLASIVSASFSSLTSSSSSTSTSSFNSEKPGKYVHDDKIHDDDDDDNETRDDREISSSTPESTLITIYQCQVCNKQQQGNIPICFQCRDNEEVARLTQSNTSPIMPTRKSLSPIPIEFNKDNDDKIYDNVTKIDEEPVEQNSPTLDDMFYVSHHDTTLMNDNQGQKKPDDEENQHCQSPLFESKSALTSLTMAIPVKTRINNLTEIDENDFFYQGPSPYVATIDNILISDQITEASIPSYKIDEYIEEDDHYERDHVKELEETIANLSRHFPVSSQKLNTIEINPIVTNLRQPSTLCVDEIDVDSILEMEIESPPTDERYIQSSSSLYSTSTSSQHPLNAPITVPILTNNRRGSLSRSSGIRENLTDLLIAAKKSTELYPSDTRSLHRTASSHSKRIIPIHRQKRNLPTVPLATDHIQLRRTNSESRFCLPAVRSAVLMSNSNIDDECDLLEIDLNDPMGSMKRASRSKTESEININNDINYDRIFFNTTNQSPSFDRIYFPKTQKKQLKDQTTNTPPISNLNSTMKTKKKLKKKGSSSPNNYHTSSTYINGQSTPTATSPTLPNPPSIVLPSPAATPTTTATSTPYRPKLQKSTSTEISYPFQVSKLILSLDRRNTAQKNDANLGLRITGGHSLPNCDEVLELGGVSLRGKSALFVQNLMNSIQDEFEIVVRSQHVIPTTSPPIEIHKPESIKSNNRLAVLPNSSLAVDQTIQRRHSMDTTQHSQQHSANNPVAKSLSTMLPLPTKESNDVSDQLLSPTMTRKKSISSKERLFSVESLHRASSMKSVEYCMKAPVPPTNNINPIHNDTYIVPEQERTHSMKRYEQKPISLSVTTPEHEILHEDSTMSTQITQPPRKYELRNSLLPNDPGLNGVASSQSVDRRNSNESDESDNLSQYFRSPTSRKSSLMTTNEVSNVPNKDLPHETKPNVSSNNNNNNTATVDASTRLQGFIKSPEEQRPPRDSTGGSFKFLKKKTKSVDFSNPPIEIRANDYVGDIELQIGHNSEREQLVIRIVKAKNLLAKDTNGYSDPFVKVYLLPGRDQENKRRTKHISKNLNPLWDYTVIYGNMHREELQYKMLEFTVWDYDRFKANDFLGQVTIDLKDANVIDDKPHWYRLQALRSREEATNRGSSPRLYKMTSVDSTGSSASAFNKSTANLQPPANQNK